VKRLTKAQVLILHAQLLAATGGAGGVRDENLLESALEAPLPGLTTAEQTAALVPFQWFLGQAASGLVLTKAGYLRLTPPDGAVGRFAYDTLTATTTPTG